MANVVKPACHCVANYNDVFSPFVITVTQARPQTITKMFIVAAKAPSTTYPDIFDNQDFFPTFASPIHT